MTKWIAGLALAAGAGLGTAANRAATTDVGRYQVVNGMPTYAKTITLLDTATGASWIACEDKDGHQNWCRMYRSDE